MGGDRPIGEMAHAAGLDPGYCADIEAGRADLTALTYLDVLRLSEVLGVPPATVLADPEIPTPRRPT